MKFSLSDEEISWSYLSPLDHCVFLMLTNRTSKMWWQLSIFIDSKYIVMQPSHLVFGIQRFRINIWHFIKAFDIMKIL